MSATGKEDEKNFCDRCGRPAIARIEGEWLCESCYQDPGSCCMEFGGDDLWTFEEENEGKKKE